jgi:hypothetical protein
MFLRLLITSLCLLSLLQTSLAQHSGPDDVPEMCPATKAPIEPFVPPSPYSARAGKNVFWYGSDELWTSLPTTGTWRGLPHSTPAETSFGQKMAWGRQGFDWHAEPWPELKVTGSDLILQLRPSRLAVLAMAGYTGTSRLWWSTSTFRPSVAGRLQDTTGIES